MGSCDVDVNLEARGRTAIVEMRRPPHNFFDGPLISRLASVFERVDADPELRAIVLCAQGKSFCAGHDFKGDSSDESRRAARAELYEGARRLFACRTPIVGAIQGAAIGGGLGLAMVCDFRIASPETRFSAPFVKLGLSPGFGLTYTLPRVLGPQKAALLTYTGRRIEGDVALAWGLVDDLAPADQLRSRAVALADEIAAAAPLAVGATRQTLRGDIAEAVGRAMEVESHVQQVLSTSEDCAEGTRAAMERREAIFVGR